MKVSSIVNLIDPDGILLVRPFGSGPLLNEFYQALVADLNSNDDMMNHTPEEKCAAMFRGWSDFGRYGPLQFFRRINDEWVRLNDNEAQQFVMLCINSQNCDQAVMICTS